MFETRNSKINVGKQPKEKLAMLMNVHRLKNLILLLLQNLSFIGTLYVCMYFEESVSRAAETN
jgi:hypothetical protein